MAASGVSSGEMADAASAARALLELTGGVDAAAQLLQAMSTKVATPIATPLAYQDTDAGPGSHAAASDDMEVVDGGIGMDVVADEAGQPPPMIRLCTPDRLQAMLAESCRRFDAGYSIVGDRIYPAEPVLKLKECLALELAVQVHKCERLDSHELLVVKSYGLPSGHSDLLAHRVGPSVAINLSAWDPRLRKMVARELDIMQALEGISDGMETCMMTLVHEKVFVNNGLIYMARPKACIHVPPLTLTACAGHAAHGRQLNGHVSERL